MTTIPLRQCWFSSAGKPVLLFQEHAGFNHFATTFVVYKGFKRSYINKHEQFFFFAKKNVVTAVFAHECKCIERTK